MDESPLIVALDCNVLICLCGKNAELLVKVNHLLDTITKAKGKVIIPTPAIAEFLVHADRASLALIDQLQRQAAVRVADFDLASAYEHSLIDGSARSRGDKRDGVNEPWQKVKFDRQIVAIAKTNGAKLIVSDDASVRANAARVGIRSTSVDDLPIPDSARQHLLPIQPADHHL